MRLKLNRPLVFFDLETTGVNIATDRIVELSYYKVFPNGSTEAKTYRVKPMVVIDGVEQQMHIPEGASNVHHIYDDDLRDCPTFKEIAAEVAKVLEGCDLAGYNSNHFDVPLLAEEFARTDVNIDLKRMKLVDAFTIFTKNEPRNLTAAYKFYCGKDLADAHSANADTMATYEVLMAQLERYSDVPDTVEGLAEYTQGKQKYADFAGRIYYNDNGEECFAFGKYRDQKVADVFRHDTGYYGWLIGGDFPEYTKKVFTRIFLDLRK